METRDHADLVRLDAFIASIQAASTVSEPAAKMYKLFQVLYNLAKRYIELNLQSQPEKPMVSETEAQLAALGFPHVRDWSLGQQQLQQPSDALEGMDTSFFNDTSNLEVGME